MVVRAFWVVAAALFAVAMGGVASGAELRDGLWAHQRSDLAPDPGVTFGKLSNGMRYMLKRNVTPQSGVTIYLRIAAGSLHEADDQRGLAHFLEHLAFQGSKNVAAGEMLKTLQRLGARPGADANAFTSFDETVYQMDLPKADTATVDTAFMLMREIADRLLLTQEAMDKERGVVLEEMKLSERPAARAARVQFQGLFPGVRHNERWAIGEKSIIEKASVATVRKFYNQYYRPERSMLIVVGDVDPAAIEAKIGALFSDWKQPGRAGRNPDIGRYKATGLRAGSFADSTIGESVSINRVEAEKYEAPTKATYIDGMRRGVGLAIANQRLSVLARKPDIPFDAAALGAGSIPGVAEFVRIAASTGRGNWYRTLQSIEQEVRRIATHGVNQIELNRQIRRLRDENEAAARGAVVMTNPVIAQVLLASVKYDFVFLSVEQHVVLREEALKGMTVDNVNIEFRKMLAPEPSFLFVASAVPVVGGEARMTQAYLDSVKVPVEAPALVAARPFPYTSFGTPGKVVERREIAELGATEVKFENGMRLNVKSTDFRKEEIGVSVRFAGGILDFPRNESRLRSAYTNSWVYGGLKQIDYDDLIDTVADRQVGAFSFIDDDAYQLTGGTKGQDLLFQLQLLTAYTTEPAFRARALDSVKAEYREGWRRRRATPRSVLGFELGSVLHSKDARWTAPTPEMVTAMTNEHVQTTMEAVLRERPTDISIVGDVSVDDAINVVAQTLGALPKRAKSYKAPEGARDVRYPAEGQSLTLTHDGRADQAIAQVAWPGPDYHTNPREARAFRLLREMVWTELLERLRAQGKAYTPEATSFTSRVFPNFGFLSVAAETSPGDVDGVYSEVDAIVAGIRDGNVTDDMVVRARTPLLSTLENAMRTNSYWLGALADYQSDPRGLGEQTTFVTDYQSITKDEMIAVARKYLTEARRVQVRVIPASAAIASLLLHKSALPSFDLVMTMSAPTQLTTGFEGTLPLKLGETEDRRTPEGVVPELPREKMCWFAHLPC